MKKKISVVIGVLTIVSAIACASVPPTHFYSLRNAQVSENVIISDSDTPSLGVHRFEAEGIYARDNFLFRSGSYEITPDYYRRWAVPPQKMLADLTADRLRRENLFSSVELLPSMQKVDLLLQGRILHFEEVPEPDGHYALVSLELNLQYPRLSEMLWRGVVSEKIRIDSPVTSDGIVAAIDKALGSCLDQAAEALSPVLQNLQKAGN